MNDASARLLQRAALIASQTQVVPMPGDPAPGRSALDQMCNIRAEPAQPRLREHKPLWERSVFRFGRTAVEK